MDLAGVVPFLGALARLMADGSCDLRMRTGGSPVVTQHEDSQTIRAAGGVLWRQADSVTAEVALVHRPQYRDWSLPKGKLRRGEHPLVTACREVAEETGIRAVAGRRLEIGHYDTAAGPKAVEYWAMQGPGTLFTPTAEVDELAWMSLADARIQLEYRSDGYAIDALESLPVSALVPAVLLVRNGQTVSEQPRADRDGDGQLDLAGQEQACDLSRTLPAFGPSTLLSACGAQFTQTMQPLGSVLGLDVCDEPTLGDEAYARHPGRGQSRILELASTSGSPAAVCASGMVIQHLLAALAEDAELVPREFPAGCGSVYALFFVGGQLAAADYYPSLFSPRP